MKFIRDLIGRTRQMPGQNSDDAIDPLEQSYRDTIGSLTDETAIHQRASGRSHDPAAAAPAPAAPPPPEVNIWDLDLDDDPTALPASVAQMDEIGAMVRAPRPKTRLIGFEKPNGDIVDLFNDTPQAATAARPRFPVGWVVVAEGPGRGASFALLAGLSPIGRGEDQAVQLDFGDTAISRNNHAAIVYDSETHRFWLGHGGKANIVRRNGTPVIATEQLASGDMIRIGETTLRFVALCDSDFNWTRGGDSAEDDHVAIA